MDQKLSEKIMRVTDEVVGRANELAGEDGRPLAATAIGQAYARMLAELPPEIAEVQIMLLRAASVAIREEAREERASAPEAPVLDVVRKTLKDVRPEFMVLLRRAHAQLLDELVAHARANPTPMSDRGIESLQPIADALRARWTNEGLWTDSAPMPRPIVVRAGDASIAVDWDMDGEVASILVPSALPS
jgi:hypothetical protein